ncbi:uncharacterized protein LOC111364799 [Spodoptera litura]|uniref:Uncharacterized protein LOC111364799 n=1 Tax=Spodoptera litura TaxID=69820 RepID=A0A9J7J0R7_SPOLT|nr:uncharacterized protein LOC111364799 [Spodoptera litura]
MTKATQIFMMKWSEDSKSNNWAIGCYALQHQLNSEIQGNRQSAAFENVFAFNTSLKNIAKYNESDTESDITNKNLDATLDASNSKIDESKEGSTTILADDSLKSGGSKEEPVMMLVDNSSKFVESIEEPVDTLEDGAVKDLVIILDDNSTMHVTEKEKLDAVLADDNSNCSQLAEELNDIPQNLTEKQDMISILSSDGSNCASFEDKPDDVSDSEYPKCVGIQIEDSDDMFDDDDSKCIEFTEPSIMLKCNNAKSSELEKESDVVLEEKVPKSAGLQERPNDISNDDAPKCIEMQSDPVTRFDGIFKYSELTEKKSDTILNENDLGSSICVEMHSGSKPTLSDNVPKCLEVPTKQVMRLDGDISKSDKQTKESDSLLDDYDPKRTEIQAEPIAILPDIILKHNELTKQPDAILTADFIKCHELMEVEPQSILDDKDPKCVEMKTDSNVTLDDNGELKEKLDVIMDDSGCHEVEAEPEITKSDRDLKCIETNTTLNDNILKPGEVTNECNLILNNDDPNLDKMDVDSSAILSDKDPKCIEMQTNMALNDILKHSAVTKESNLILNNEEPDLDKMDEDSDAILSDKDPKCLQTEPNATLEDDTSKQSQLTEEPNMKLDDDHEKVAIIDADDLEIDEPKEEVNDRLKVDSSKPTVLKESDGGPSLTTKLDSPKPSTSGLTSNVDYDSDDSDIVIVSEDPLA